MGKKLVVVIAIVVVLGLAGVATWLFVSGKLTWAGNGVQPTGVKIVCGNDIVTTFNKARDAAIRDDSGVEKVDVEGQKQVAEKVQTLDGYENDPTCQTIVFLVNYQEQNYEATKAAYEAIGVLHEQNIYANNNLSGVESMDTYRVMTEGLSPENIGKGRNGDE